MDYKTRQELSALLLRAFRWLQGEWWVSLFASLFAAAGTAPGREVTANAQLRA